MTQGTFITGMGIVCSIAHDTDEFSSALQDGVCGIESLRPVSNQSASGHIGATIRDFSLEKQLLACKLPAPLAEKANECARRAPKPIQTSVLAALQAWQQAQLHDRPVPADRIAIVVASDNACQAYQFESIVQFQQTPEYLSPRYALHALTTDCVGTISEIFSIHGEGFCVGGASASGNVAIIKGMQLLQLGLADVCVVVGASSDLSPLALQGFHNLGAMGGKRFQDQPRQACRPFDEQHEGFIPGQGSGCLILESGQSVANRSAVRLARILGGSLLLDGNRLSNPSESGEARAMQHCLRLAAIEPHQVDYINSHGTSSPLGDVTELKAIRQVFHGHLARLWINSTKGLTGHCLFSAGVIEAIACVLQMQGRFLHPNMNLNDSIDREFRFVGATAIEATVDIAMSNSFGFGGINSSVLLEAQRADQR
jgi:malonyl-ACP decarboxylase